MVTSRSPANLTAALSRNVRATRLAEGLTLDGLAMRAGISKGMVVQVEQGRTNPSLTTLSRLANALGVSLPQLLDAGPTEAAEVVPREANVVFWSGRGEGEGRLLAASDEPSPLELWDVRLGPGEAYAAEPQAPGTVEMVYVLAGRLVVRVEEERVEAGVGDTVVLRPDRAHEYRNAGDERVHLVIANMEGTKNRAAP